MKFRYLAVLVLMSAVFIGCADLGSGNTTPKDWPTDWPSIVEPKFKGLRAYTGCVEMETELKQVFVSQMEQQLQKSKKMCVRSSDGDDGMVSEPTAVGDSEDGATYTETNVQEKGVDEADLIKTDGKFAYAIVGDSVKIAKVWPFAEFGLQAEITPKYSPVGLYISGTNLVIISKQTEKVALAVEVYDVSNSISPRLAKTSEYDGEYLDSRVLGGRIHLVINDALSFPKLEYSVDRDLWPDCGEEPGDDFKAAIEALREKNIGKIEAMDLDVIVPFVKGRDDTTCQSTLRSHYSFGSRVLELATEDIASADGVSTQRIFASGGTVYASENNIVVASDYATTDAMGIGVSGGGMMLHRFSLAQRAPAYVDSAEVEGYLVQNDYVGSRHSARFSMDQFAMSEFEGKLRVATTVGQSESFVHIFDLKTAGMPEVGSVGGIGKGEWVHGVRFDGTKGYVVTFKKTDPLFVIDLSDPTRPYIAGEVEMPGFSTYLHPVSGGRLIGLGFDVDDMGSSAWTAGLKLSMFDVSKPDAPAEIGKEVIGARGSYSAAIEEHHAFTFDESRGLIALPLTMCEGAKSGSSVGKYSYSGVILFNVDESGKFDEVGEIKLTLGSGMCNVFTQEEVPVQRTIIIGDGNDEGVVTLVTDGMYLNRIDTKMTLVGQI